MISVFQIFKIVLGVVIAGFILFFAFRFAGSYMEIGESSMQVSILVNFKKSVNDVYTTGIPADFDMKEVEIVDYVAPYIITPVTRIDMEPIPFVLVPGEKVSIHRNEYDLGWWKFYFIETLPETNVMYVLEANKENTRSVMGNITEAFPSGENTKTKTRFGLGCAGEDVWVGIDRFYFLEKVMPGLMTTEIGFGVCENIDYLKGEGYKIITISEDLMEADFLVRPTEGGIGYVYIYNNGEYEQYIYKNGLDIVALFLGGKRLYDYINGKFMNELEVAVDTGIRESNLLLSDPNMNKRCEDEFYDLIGTLNAIKETIPKMVDVNEDAATEFIYYMKDSVKKYRALEILGCA